MNPYVPFDLLEATANLALNVGDQPVRRRIGLSQDLNFLWRIVSELGENNLEVLKYLDLKAKARI